MKTYLVDGNPVEVDDKDVSAFIKNFPNAKEAVSFIVDNDTVDVDINDLESFKKSYPNAKELYPSSEKKNLVGKGIQLDLQGGGAVGATDVQSTESEVFKPKRIGETQIEGEAVDIFQYPKTEVTESPFTDELKATLKRLPTEALVAANEIKKLKRKPTPQELQGIQDKYGITKPEEVDALTKYLEFGLKGEKTIEPSAIDYISNAWQRGTNNARLSSYINMGRMPSEEELKTIAEINRFELPASKITEKFNNAPDFNSAIKELAVADASDFGLWLAENVVQSLGALYKGAPKVAERALQSGAVGAGVGTAIPAIGTAAGGMTGAGYGYIVGMGEQSANLEYANTFIQSLKDSGVDITDEASLKKALNNENLIKEAKKKAMLRGVPVGFFDGLSAGIGGKIVTQPGKSAFGKMAKALAEPVVQAGLGGAGAAAGQLASEGKITDGKEIFTEIVAEFGTSPVEILTGSLRNNKLKAEKKPYSVSKNKTELFKIFKGATKEEIDFELARLVALGKITEDQKQMMSDLIMSMNEADKVTPQGIPNRDEAVVIISEKKELEKEAENVDTSFQPIVQDQITQLSNNLLDLVSGTTTTPTVSEPVQPTTTTPQEQGVIAPVVKSDEGNSIEGDALLKEIDKNDENYDSIKDAVKGKKFIKQTVSINELVAKDKDLQEYLNDNKATKGRKIEKAIIVGNIARGGETQKGGVIDGFHRIAQAIANGENKIDAFVEQSIKEQPKTETATAVLEPLKDVESIQQALYNLYSIKDFEEAKQMVSDLFDLIKKKDRDKIETNLSLLKKSFDAQRIIAEAYHKAKQDGSNPELVKAVEELLTPKIEQDAKPKKTAETPKEGEGVKDEKLLNNPTPNQILENINDYSKNQLLSILRQNDPNGEYDANEATYEDAKELVIDLFNSNDFSFLEKQLKLKWLNIPIDKEAKIIKVPFKKIANESTAAKIKEISGIDVVKGEMFSDINGEQYRIENVSENGDIEIVSLNDNEYNYLNGKNTINIDNSNIFSIFYKSIPKEKTEGVAIKKSEIDGKRLLGFKKGDIVYRNYGNRYEEYEIINDKKDIWTLQDTRSGRESKWNAANNEGFILKEKTEQNAKEQQSGQMREQSVQDQPQRKGDSDMPIVNEAELQDREVVEEEVNEKEGNLVLPKKGEATVKVGEVNAKFKDANKVMGEETTIEMPNGETRQSEYMVVELDDIMASHNEISFGNTDGFPSYNGENANTRNYKGDDKAKARVEENAQKLKPSIVISDTATPDSGVPIISKDGIIVSGNGRAMSIKRAKKQYGDKYDAYKEALIKKAAKFGIDANKVSEMKNPILVKIDNSVTEYTPKVFDDYNKPLQKAEAPIDKAIKRSNIIRGNNTLKNKVLEIVGRHETMSDLFANKADTKLLIENLVSNEVILPQEVAEFVNKDGTLTDSGKDLVNDILIATVLNAETLRATENVKGFRNKLINSLPLLSANYGLGDYSLEQEINDAIKLQSDVAAWGNQEDFWKYINQLGVFDVVNPNTVIINRLINSGKNNFKDFVRIYNQSAGTDEMNLFGAGEVLTKQQIIDNLKKSKLNEDERKIIAGLEGIYDDAIAQRQERDAGVAKEKDKKQQLDEKQRELDNKIAEEKKKLDDLNKKGENLGFAFDPKAEAERQYNIHKTLVSIAKLYIQKGVTTAQQFANEVGLRLQDVSRAFEEALGKKTYSKDDITNSPYDTDYIRIAWQPTLPQQQNQIEIDANDAIANGAISFVDFNNAMSANAAYSSLPNSSKQIIYNNAVATYSNTQAINQANQNNQPNPTINLKEQTWLEKVKTAFQDRLTRLKDIQKQMELAGIQILDQANVALKYELLIGKSKAKIDEKYQQIVKSNNKNKPALFERLVKEGGDVDELGIYMYALHAQERNAAVAQMRQDEFNQAIIELTDKINNATTQAVKTRFQNELTALVQGKGKVKLLPDGGSGMTNQQANDIIDAVNQSGKRALYDRYAQDFRNEVINPALDQQLQYGLISQESYDLIKAKYQNYVPLQVVEKALEKRIGGGTGAGNVRGKDIYKSKGSDLYKYTDRYNPVVSSLFNYNNAIIRGEQNLVNKTLIELANLDTQNEVFEIHKPKYTPIVDANGDVKYLIPMLSDAIKNNSVETKVDGMPVFVEIKDKALLDAIRQNGVVRGVRGLHIINTWLRNTATIMNPEFIFTNFSRDFETALINIQSEMVDNNIKGLTRKIANPKNIFNAGRGILEDYKGNHNSVWAKAAKEYRDSGGQVSWFQKETLDEYVNDIENKIKSIKKGENIPIKVLNNLGETLFLTQSVVEQSLRLATFKALRDAGVSAERAASAAKNITVNFETKGTWSGLVDSIYLFANAGIQGSYRMTKSLATSKKAQGAAAFLFTAGIFEAYLNDIFGGEDDDDEQISDKVKERNFVLVNPENSKDIYFKFPLAYGANVFKYAGNIVYDVANGRKTPIKGTTEILLSIYNQFSPIQGATISQALSPTFFDPIVQGVQNKNFMDAPIKPEQVKYQPSKKESDLYFSSVRPISKDMATWLNENTGGTDIKAGYIDISPEYIDHYFDAFTGGTGRFIANVGATTRSLVDDEQKYEIRNTPFVRSFVGEPREKRNLQFIYNTFDRSLKDVLTDEEMKKFEKELDLAVSTGSMQRDTAKKLLKQVKKAQRQTNKENIGETGLGEPIE